MTDSIFGSGWRALLLVGLSVVGIALTVRAERESESRANRLHRADRLEEAAEIYVDRAAEESTAERLHYNLGTTLLRLGSLEAAQELTTATESDDERVRVGAHYIRVTPMRAGISPSPEFSSWRLRLISTSAT